MNKVLILGGFGQLGYDVQKEIYSKGISFISPDIKEFDITNKSQTLKYIKEYNPDLILNIAAYTNVDQAEIDKESCYDVNVNGTINIINAAKEISAKLCFISTEYIFDGNKEGYYEIDDKPNPLSYYGQTKMEAEKYIIDNYNKYFIIRTSWLFGINGKNFVTAILNIAKEKDEIAVVSDQVGSPTYTVDLSQKLIEICNTNKFGIYHVTNSGFCSRDEFARYILSKTKLSIKVKPISSVEFGAKATRPKNSKLSNKTLRDQGFFILPSWESGVNRFLDEIILNGEKENEI